jgi:GNAT superfamily N-acetyltransferase
MPDGPYRTRELAPDTWPDFERFFSGGNGWDFCWCVAFHRTGTRAGDRGLRRAELGERNRPEKRRLVEQGRSHGILVYLDGTPIGWCQFGRRDELPRIDRTRKYRAAATRGLPENLWRITCFAVDRKHRRQGVAAAALAGALEAIARRGGGVVEAYPIETWRRGTMADMATHGPVEIFRAAGFEPVAPYGDFNRVMRRTV